MLKNINNLKFFFLNILFILTPFVQFFQTNYNEIVFYLTDLLKIFLFILFFILIIFFSLKKKTLTTIISFLFFIFFSLSFLV